jgi:hypothetical protein
MAGHPDCLLPAATLTSLLLIYGSTPPAPASRGMLSTHMYMVLCLLANPLKVIFICL